MFKAILILSIFVVLSFQIEVSIDLDYYERWCFQEFIGTDLFIVG